MRLLRPPRRACRTWPDPVFQEPISGQTTSHRGALSWPLGVTTFQTVPEKSASCLTSSRLTARNAFTARSFEWGLAHAEISQFSARQPLFGRPNISGVDNPYGIEILDGYSVLSGAFFSDSGNLQTMARGHSTGSQVGRVTFDASRSAGIYGASSKVQPSSLLGLACIKF